jgi:hypothetical protein
MQLERFEKKYWISEEQASRVREYLGTYLEPDENEAGTPDLTYPVHTVYLDSADLATYWMTINGDRNRFKLRLRYYDTDSEAPVFCEVKRRVDKWIFKERAGVRREAIPWLLGGGLPEAGEMLSKAPRQVRALQQFTELVCRLEARPKVHVTYRREAWVNPSNAGVRVTLDRHVQAGLASAAGVDTEMREACRPFGNKVVLELKFTECFPNWLREMVESFNLVQCNSPKYCESVDTLGLEKLRSRLQEPATAA